MLSSTSHINKDGPSTLTSTLVAGVRAEEAAERAFAAAEAASNAAEVAAAAASLDAGAGALIPRAISPPTPYMSGILYDARMMLHSSLVDEEHPEAPTRISKVFQKLKSEGCVERMRRIKCREVIKEEVMLIHDEGIWEGVQRTACECLLDTCLSRKRGLTFPSSCDSTQICLSRC